MCVEVHEDGTGLVLVKRDERFGVGWIATRQVGDKAGGRKRGDCGDVEGGGLEGRDA